MRREGIEQLGGSAHSRGPDLVTQEDIDEMREMFRGLGETSNVKQAVRGRFQAETPSEYAKFLAGQYGRYPSK
jgi:hypothetical protein